MKAKIFLFLMIGLSLTVLLACGDESTNEPSTVHTTQSKVPSSDIETEIDTHCPDYNPLKNVYFGDLHAHTAISYDARIMGTTAGPEEAYSFAKGNELLLPPYNADGSGGRPAKLYRPLDFVALTDHSEYLAETRLCSTPGNSAYDSPLCRRFREDFPGEAIYEWADHQDDVGFGELPVRWEEICQQPDIDCRQTAIEIWRYYVQAAEDACEECSFTAFPAYEYTRAPNCTNLHRNIIFRNSNVIEVPLSGYEYANPEDLLLALKEQCLDADSDCDCISIPHNSNWSNGRMFTPDDPETMSLEKQREITALRARMEPLVEIYQVKGWMECRNGFPGIEYDPLCDCEKIRSQDAPDCDGVPGAGGMKDEGCVSRYDYIRNVLKLGLSEEIRLGVNPYKVGIVGSTDTHSANPGQVEEYNFAGTCGKLDSDPGLRVTAPYEDVPIKFNPGGLTAVWAEENTPDALFDAFHRREVYATTGTQLSVRFFGGWEYDSDLCGKPDFLSIGYEKGVPMGSDLPKMNEEGLAPTFAVKAIREEDIEGYPGPLLQRIQIIKGWIDADGVEHEKVFEVAGDPNNGASVDLDSCITIGDGWEELCTVWTDPEFDSEQPACYYARVLENPTCSWIQYDCNTVAASGRKLPVNCSDDKWDKTVQERAVTSPIWYSPSK